ncbi:MAG: DUF2461 domain-containing protein [Sneathiellaceae bacterium]
MTAGRDGHGFLGPEAVSFLQALAANNNRDWFTANKPRYEAVLKRPAAAFATATAGELERRTGLAHEARIYRIQRDIRFAKDKTPYNAHLHIAFTPRIDHPAPPAWMFGLEPDRLVLGAGTFAFPGAVLDRWRARVAGPDGAALATILSRLQAAGARLDEPELKRVPKPFPADHPQAALLRRKGLCAWRDDIPVAAAYGAAAPAACAQALTPLQPLFDWLRAMPA